jgi:chemotaxis signal transduction protein
MGTELCILQVDKRFYAVPMACLVEVMEKTPLWSVPLPLPDLLGLVRCDGHPVPVVDMAHWLGGPSSSHPRPVYAVAHVGEFRVALMVDRVYPATAWSGDMEMIPTPGMEKLLPGRVAVRRWWQPDAPEGDLDDPGDMEPAEARATTSVLAFFLDIEQLALHMEERWSLPLAA